MISSILRQEIAERRKAREEEISTQPRRQIDKREWYGRADGRGGSREKEGDNKELKSTAVSDQVTSVAKPKPCRKILLHPTTKGETTASSGVARLCRKSDKMLGLTLKEKRGGWTSIKVERGSSHYYLMLMAR